MAMRMQRMQKYVVRPRIDLLKLGALLVLGALLALLGACTSQQEVALSALHYFQKGNAAYEAEDYQRAVKDFRSALSFDDSAPDIWYNLGLAYYRIGAYDDAVNAYQRAIKLDPGFADANLNLALAYDKLYNAPAANLHYNRYRTLVSGNVQKDLTPQIRTAATTSSDSPGGFQRVGPGASGSVGAGGPSHAAQGGISQGGISQGGAPQGGAAGASAALSSGALSRPQSAAFSAAQGSRRTTSLLVPQTARPGSLPPAESLPAEQPTAPNPYQGSSKWWTQEPPSQNR
jgi:tetratricopeptide (TPR) repeat protein